MFNNALFNEITYNGKRSYGSKTLALKTFLLGAGRSTVALLTTLLQTDWFSWSAISQLRIDWSRVSKQTADWNSVTKHSANWSSVDKHSANWTSVTKH